MGDAAGLLLPSMGIVIGFFGERRRADVPFLAFGIFVALSAVFPHRPFVEGRAFSETTDMIHSVVSFLTGLSAVVGFIVRFVVDRNTWKRVIYLSLVVLYTILPLMMVFFPTLEGALQRVIFGSFFVWAVMDYPREERPNTGRAELDC